MSRRNCEQAGFSSLCRPWFSQLWLGRHLFISRVWQRRQTGLPLPSASWPHFPHQLATPDRIKAGRGQRQADPSAAIIMDSFVCSPFSTYQNFRSSPALGRGWDTAAKQPSWKQSKGGGISPFLGGPFTPLPSDYLDNYRRAQLQALLSQVGPALAPRPRRASTKEAAVQVSLRADAAVQCSLGPRTLPPARAFSPAALRSPGRLALYSPAPDRRLFALPDAAETAAPTEETPTADGGEEQQEGPAGAALPPRQEPAGTRREETAAPRQRAAFQVRRDGAGANPPA